MSPETHFLASWLIAAVGTDNPRDCRVVTLAGIVPDADGLGLLLDACTRAMGWRETYFYEQYHHYLLHGLPGGLVLALVLAAFARQRWRVTLLSLLVFHLHLACDFVGSRGPSPADLWPIYYFGPLGRHPLWLWRGQWRLDGWQNQVLSVSLLVAALWIAVKRGHSFVGVLSRRLDTVFTGVLVKWHAEARTRIGR